MIYTSYFANSRNFPKGAIPIAICRGVPSWYNGLVYQTVAPTQRILQEWHEDNDERAYKVRFAHDVLRNVEPVRVLNELQLMVPLKTREQMDCPVWDSDDVHIVLLCYEVAEDFCHRHLVADWLNRFFGTEKVKELGANRGPISDFPENYYPLHMRF